MTPRPDAHDEAHATEPGAGVSRAELFARAAADHALAAFQAIGTLTAETSATRAELGDVRREIAALRDEVRAGFRDLRRTRAELAELTDEIEDTKARTLKTERDAARKQVARLRKVAVGLASTVAAGLALAALLRWLHL